MKLFIFTVVALVFQLNTGISFAKTTGQAALDDSPPSALNKFTSSFKR